ncbi:single-stranded-DNA-specific exonuclease RecJ [Cytobacillus oceanisediminis]
MHWINNDVPFQEHPKKDKIIYYSRYFNCHPLLMQYLFLHGMENTEELYNIFSPSFDNLHDPFLLNDMKKAGNRILKGIHQQEKILVFGDYDCDGITSTSILYKYLKKNGVDVSYRLPLREEGYGISPYAITEAASIGVSLIITVDNGSSAHEAMGEAAKRGIDVIVTDHHEILGENPNCYAFINPKRHDNLYPFPELCGAGVAFKLVHALCLLKKQNWDTEVKEYIELATLGTIADLMPLKGENRIICKLGLRRMNVAPSIVFREIIRRLKVNQINSGTIGFQIAPIFNALGRIDDPNYAVAILTNNTVNPKDITNLFEFNQKRKQLTAEQFASCEKVISVNNLANNNIIIIYGNYHHGLIGILASKIAEKYHKPAIVISENGTGSCRSVNGTPFSIINTLNRCKNHLTRFGGHQAAAGFSIKPHAELLNNFIQNMQISAQHEGPLKPVKHFFAECSPQYFATSIYNDIHLLEPFGQGFSQPIFLSNSLMFTETQTFGKENSHGKLTLPSNECFYLFNRGGIVNKLRNQEIKLFYSSTTNDSDEFIVHGIKKA